MKPIRSFTSLVVAGVCHGSAWLVMTGLAVAQPPFPDGGTFGPPRGPQLPESPYYQPLNQHTPPGVAGQWAGALRRADSLYFQPVRISLPGGGKVTFLDTARGQQQTLNSPAQAGLTVGPVYRIILSDMPEFPGVVLYPTLELIDRLHPPADLRQKYPIPVDLTEDDIQQAIRDHLVTKIIYIEQPDLADPVAQRERIREENIPLNKNLMTEADLRGRPCMYLRIGGRIPSPQELNANPLQIPGPVEFAPPR